MKTILVFPPFWSASQPYLSLPSIAAYLKKHGIDEEQIDLNLQIYDYVLSEKFLTKCMKRIKKQNNENVLSAEERDLLQIMDFMSRNINIYKNMFRSEVALDINVYTKCFSIIDCCLATISKLYEKETLSFVYYEHNDYSELKSKDVIRCMEDVKKGKLKDSLVYELVYPFVERIACEHDLVGISLTGSNQIIPAYIFATLLKERNPKIKIVVGGNIVSRWCTLLQSNTDLFKNIDFYMYGEGEYPFTRLIAYMEGKIPIKEVPNILYVNEENKVVMTEDNCYLDINTLPTPIFNKDEIKKYFSPKVVMPLLESRGCFWGKCSFCDHSYIYHGKYRKRSIDLVIEDIKTLANEYGCCAINFHDEAIAPVEMSALSDRLLAENLQIKWTTCARLDLAMSRKLLQKAHNAGLKILFFGLESINQRVLQKMQKGTKTETIKQILQDSASVNIWNHLFYICGFPTETKEEFNETLGFVQKNSEYIHSSGCSYFTLGKYCDVYYHPEKYDLDIIENHDNDLALFTDYKMHQEYGYQRKDYLDNIDKLSSGKFLYATNWVYRDHWILFSDYLFQENEVNEENRVDLGNRVVWEVIGGKLVIYKINHGKMEIIKLDAKYHVFLDAIVKYGEREKIIEEIALIAHASKEKATKYWNAFYKVLREHNLLDLKKRNTSVEDSGSR